MLVCKKCEKEFPINVVVDDKVRNLQRRKFCLDCSPFGKHNTRDLKKIELHAKKFGHAGCGERFCPLCKFVLPIGDFYKRENNKASSYCKKCTNLEAVLRQRKFKKECVEYKGGKCVKCGYNRYFGALDFHHIDPSKKDFVISRAKSWKFKNAKEELNKCILLCSNCHREQHAIEKGIFTPDRS